MNEWKSAQPFPSQHLHARRQKKTKSWRGDNSAQCKRVHRRENKTTTQKKTIVYRKNSHLSGSKCIVRKLCIAMIWRKFNDMHETCVSIINSIYKMLFTNGKYTHAHIYPRFIGANSVVILREIFPSPLFPFFTCAVDLMKDTWAKCKFQNEQTNRKKECAHFIWNLSFVCYSRIWMCVFFFGTKWRRNMMMKCKPITPQTNAWLFNDVALLSALNGSIPLPRTILILFKHLKCIHVEMAMSCAMCIMATNISARSGALSPLTWKLEIRSHQKCHPLFSML